jgi:hypothetical protein
LSSNIVTLTGGGGYIVTNLGYGYPVFTSNFWFTNVLLTAGYTNNGSGAISYGNQTAGSATPPSAVAGFILTGSTTNLTIQINVNAPDDSANSVYVNIDNAPAEPANVADIIPFTSGFQDRNINQRGTGSFDAPQYTNYGWTLSAGLHKVTVQNREASVLLKSLLVNSAQAGDITPPIISAITATPTTNSATITWTTDEGAKGYVSYGDNNVGFHFLNSTNEPGFVTSHSITIGSLIPTSIYYYSILQNDAANNLTNALYYSFTTSTPNANTNFANAPINLRIIR